MEKKTDSPVFCNEEDGHINWIRLYADCAEVDSPRDERTKSMVAFRSGDSVGFEITLFNGGVIADCADIAKVDFEILDIGQMGSPLPRHAKLNAKKVVEASSINKELVEGDLTSGECHFKIVLSSNETSIGSGHRYLRVCAYNSKGDRTTFASGWILIQELFDCDLADTPEASISKAEELESQIAIQQANIDALGEKIDGISDDLSTSKGEIESRLSALEERGGDIDALESRVDSISGEFSSANANLNGRLSEIQEQKADKGSTISEYGITDAYTKAQTDDLFAQLSGEFSTLQASKANTGMLYFTGRPYGINDLMSVGELFSVAYRTDFQFASGSATTNQYKPWTIGSDTAYIAPAALSDDLFRILYNGNGFYSFKGANIRAAVQDINSIIAIVNNPTGGNITITLYVNGVQIPQNSYTAQVAQTFTGYRVNTQGGTASLIDTTMKDFAVFNFDMSAADAPYSVADYSAGKPVPPSALSQTAVLLENYTFTVGSTQYIPDVSGNNYDATITGTGIVAGTFDASIAKLASLITSTNA